MNEFLPKSWVVDDQGVRIFILAGSEKALIVDSGMTGLNVMGLARKYTNLPLELLNTHADHAGAPPGAPFYVCRVEIRSRLCYTYPVIG